MSEGSNGEAFGAHVAATIEAFGAVVAASMWRAARAAKAEAQKLAPPGIAKTIEGVPEPEGFALESDHVAAGFVEAGTRAHIIEGAPLVFQAAGGTVFARRVHHPGTKAHPYMQPGMEEGARVFVASMGELFPS